MKSLLLKLLLVSDEEDRESTTLGFVAIAFLVVTVKFALGGFWELPEVSVVDYSLAFAAIMAVWVGKNWVQRSTAAQVEVAEAQAEATIEAAKHGVAVPAQGKAT